MRKWEGIASVAAILCCAAGLRAQPQPLAPSIVAGPVDQLGPDAGDGDLIFPADFLVLPRTVNLFEGNALVGRARIDLPPPIITDPPEFGFFEDRVHGSPPLPITKIAGRISAFGEVEKTAPALAPVFGDPDLVAAALTRDGSTSGKMELELLQIPLDGDPLGILQIEVDSAGVPFAQLHSVDVVQDELDRMTAVYTAVTGSSPSVRAQRVDWDAVALLEDFEIDLPAMDPEVAMLDPRGDRLVVVYKDGPGLMGTIKGRMVDTTGPAPTVLPEFPISTTAPTFDLIDPSVAADVNTGEFVVAWTDLTGLPSNPADIRARRFDAAGTPAGPDFVVNTTTANTQDQAQVAFGPGGLWAVTWAGDSAATESLDVFFQVFDRDGNTLGSENRANAGLVTEMDHQDHPVVRFLPLPDTEGRPQLAVAWRDVGDLDGTYPYGSGTISRCFSIDGLPEAQAIFTDGFESGDLAAWSSSVGGSP